jgi:hypothetical protein
MVADWYPYSGRAPGEIAAAADYVKGGDRVYVTSWHAGNSLGDRDLQERTPIEKLQAEGFGTLTTLPTDRQDGHGKAEWKDGVWSLVLIVPRAQDRFAFAPGMTIPVAFAAWDGASDAAASGVDWYFMVLKGRWNARHESILVSVRRGQAWAMRWLRRRAEQGGGGVTRHLPVRCFDLPEVPVEAMRRCRSLASWWPSTLPTMPIGR